MDKDYVLRSIRERSALTNGILSLCFLLSVLSGGSAVAASARQPDLRAYRDHALGREGNASRGKELFFSDTISCGRCHTVDGSAGKAGPDLFAAGDKLPRRDLINAILEPSASIAVGYGTTLVDTKDDTLAGIVKQITDGWVELAQGDGRTVRIPTNEIVEQRGSIISLMPEGLHAGMSLNQFTDLVEYLAALKQPESAGLSEAGMPNEIPELAQGVTLRSFFSEEMRFPHAFIHKPGDVRSGLVWFGHAPGISNGFVVVHQTGKIWLLEKTEGGDEKSVFADFHAELFNERGPNGLLGLAFHPQYRENLKYYVKHQVFEEGKIATVVVEKIATPDFRKDSGKPSRRLLKIVSATQDHSGGCIQFGPDGFLYIGMGDTGPQRDPQGHGQNLKTLLAKISRIDVDRAEGDKAYAIPKDNPYLGTSEALPEIWALGFREPWRFSFDPVTADLWAGDVGQDRVEEVAIVRRGENHGWNAYEGFEPFSNQYKKDDQTYIPPVFAYKRKYGNSITGGYVYRGDKKSSFYGVYICGDYTSKRIWGLRQENRRLTKVRQLGVSPQFIASFGTDEQGNIYVVGYEGMVYKMDFGESNFDGSVVLPGKSGTSTKTSNRAQ